MFQKYLLPLLLAALPLAAQKHNDGVFGIAEAERRSASQVLFVQVNPDTYNYDVTYHKLEFTVDPNEYFISGKVTTTFTALENMNQVIFDLADALDVSSVKQGTTNLTFTQNFQDELVITLPSTLTTGNSATVEITYSGMPPFDNQGFSTSSHNGSPILWTLSEPFGAKDWWPCKQDLNDKADSIDVYITAPSDYVSVSNGLEVEQTVSGTNKTTHFHHGHPIAAYLVAIAVTNYSVFTVNAGTAPNEFPIINYVYPENLGSAQNNIAITPDIMDFYEQTFGTYPFSDEKYGHAQFGWGGGMEHQTVSFMGGFNRELIAHELGHHWFGDKVTCGTWKDIWLNEGFATYMAAMIIESFDGADAFVNYKDGLINYICSQPGGSVYMTDSEALNTDRIFSSRLSYYKGAMAIEMLRWKLGDTNFFAGLQAYLTDPDHAYGYALTEDLKTHLEAASGMELDEFFSDWIYNQGYPSYDITAHNTAPGMVHFTVNQTQSHPSVTFFEMPVPVRVFGAGGQQLDVVLENTVNGQGFDVAVPFVVTSLEFDPDKHILALDNSATLGISTANGLSGISVYPNPASAQINISVPQRFSVSGIKITNVLGQTELLVGETSQINVSSLSTGVHFLTVFADGRQRTFKFIKE
ncbi:M1 family aminopeptidase [Flavobacterium silvaticum]|uniref:Aminopeptidase N n=1 Tax=Flavobacterium silvaticum TaxID=1852020 RepID=A0A972FM92_9FLAO|nr:M1 family aminopeptidase [Flavobacterium silvaticum]NMH28262.1 T9SS type A sorting domain-containing protein [Flavobacterium silvaticum]